jgi:hypothetical protein
MCQGVDSDFSLAYPRCVKDSEVTLKFRMLVTELIQNPLHQCAKMLQGT